MTPQEMHIFGLGIKQGLIIAEIKTLKAIDSHWFNDADYTNHHTKIETLEKSLIKDLLWKQ